MRDSEHKFKTMLVIVLRSALLCPPMFTSEQSHRKNKLATSIYLACKTRLRFKNGHQAAAIKLKREPCCAPQYLAGVVVAFAPFCTS